VPGVSADAGAARPMVTPAALGLGPLEAAIMTVMWQADDWLTTREIQNRIDYPTRAYTSVATVATNLERKGHLRKRRFPAANHPGPRRWQYHAAVPLAEHLGHVIGELLQCSPDPAATLRHAHRIGYGLAHGAAPAGNRRVVPPPPPGAWPGR